MRQSLRPSVCSSCGARVIWCKTVTGKNMPVDAEPVENGNLVIRKRGSNMLALVIKAEQREDVEGQPRYVSHFATCPNSRSHRKKR